MMNEIVYRVVGLSDGTKLVPAHCELKVGKAIFTTFDCDVSSLDGIAQALRIDDRCFHLLEPAVREPDRPHGRVEIDLFWREEH